MLELMIFTSNISITVGLSNARTNQTSKPPTHNAYNKKIRFYSLGALSINFNAVSPFGFYYYFLDLAVAVVVLMHIINKLTKCIKQR